MKEYKDYVVYFPTFFFQEKWPMRIDVTRNITRFYFTFFSVCVFVGCLIVVETKVKMMKQSGKFMNDAFHRIKHTVLP